MNDGKRELSKYEEAMLKKARTSTQLRVVTAACILGGLALLGIGFLVGEGNLAAGLKLFGGLAFLFGIGFGATYHAEM